MHKDIASRADPRWEIACFALAFLDRVEDTSQKGTLAAEPVWVVFALAGLVPFPIARVLPRRRHIG